jgi:hypothetical protein
MMPTTSRRLPFINYGEREFGRYDLIQDDEHVDAPIVDQEDSDDDS